MGKEGRAKSGKNRKWRRRNKSGGSKRRSLWEGGRRKDAGDRRKEARGRRKEAGGMIEVCEAQSMGL